MHNIVNMHYLVITLKQAVLSKSEHSGNNASSSVQVRLHRIKSTFGRESMVT